MAEALTLEGDLWGTGCGGSSQKGHEFLCDTSQIGCTQFLGIDELTPDCTLVTLCRVGALAAKEQADAVADNATSFELFREHANKKVAGLLSLENGRFSFTSGFAQSALKGLPVIFLLGSVPAHPAVMMGSRGLLKQENYRTMQAAVGKTSGKRDVRLIFTLERPLTRLTTQCCAR